jgi:hypothetical protein
MRPGLFLSSALIIVILVLGVTATSPAKEWKTFSRISYDWRGDSAPYEFVMRVPIDYDSGGEFTQLVIMQGGKAVLTVTDENGIAEHSLDGISHSSNEMKEMAKKNLLRSKHLLMIPNVTGRSRFPLLFFFGPGYASNPPSLHVISLGDDGVPKEILGLKNYNVHELVDLNKDSVPELIGRNCSPETYGMNEEFQTYAPFSVYRFGDTAVSPMILDLGLTRKYNEANYYGWAGPDCNQNLAVVLRPPGGGKPVIMDAKKAEALFKK